MYGLCKGIYPQNMAKQMVLTYLHFRILEFPLIFVAESPLSVAFELHDAHGGPGLRTKSVSAFNPNLQGHLLESDSDTEIMVTLRKMDTLPRSL